ncbi:MAG: MerR family transcriptional regulator [Actinomycetota bacterium]
MREDLLSISEVAETTGLRSSALRYYERAGLIRARARQGGRRHYSKDVLRRLAVIALFQEVGFTIREIATLLERGGRKDRWHSLAEGKLTEIDEHMDRVSRARELLLAALACDCAGLESCGLVTARQGRHKAAVKTLALDFGPPK